MLKMLFPTLRGGAGKELRTTKTGGRPGSGRDLEPKQRRLLRRLKELDFQLAYLALLTARGVKPASRWEKPLSPAVINAMRGLGLVVRSVTRRTLRDHRITEIIFSADPDLLDDYAARFDGRLIDKSADTVLYEGRYFGYPDCCVKRFAAKPYSPNDLDSADQAVIFHWACLWCRETPRLLDDYRSLHEIIERL